MSALKDLIDQIENPELRSRVKQEVDRLLGRKKFGLVFEDHLPESLQLPDVPIRRGSRVALRTSSPTDAMIVKSINGDLATCYHLSTKTEVEIAVSDIVCVAQFGEPIYPFLQVIDKVKNAPDNEVWHSLIEADNYHALQLLAYLYPRKVSCIYIDPPYNTGARDWKYNNNYVDSADQYRHSKWLSMMKRRLELAKLLLDPNDSVLIVTIDEKEYNHLGCLLEEMFPESNIQMVSSIIAQKGVARDNSFYRTNEFLYFVQQGSSSVNPLLLDKEWALGKGKSAADNGIVWSQLRRAGTNDLRVDRHNLFYPIIFNKEGTKIIDTGDPLLDMNLHPNQPLEELDDGLILWPIKENGTEGNWQVSPDKLKALLKEGFVKIGKRKDNTIPLSYLKRGSINKIKNNEVNVIGRDTVSGTIIVESSNYQRAYIPGSQWNIALHDATYHGSQLLKKIIGGRFSFPKSLYAVRDAIRFFVADKPNAIIVDFFAGSGTTLHAVNLLNAEDGGHRHCIMVTNNEVSEDEAKSLTRQGFKPGDKEWERLGIAQYVTWPRTRCSILGVDVNGSPIAGDYMLTGLTESEASRIVKQISLDMQSLFANKKYKKQIISLFNGEIPQSAVKDETKYLVSDDWAYAVLFDTDAADDFIDELSENQSARQIFIFTGENSIFNSIKNRIADEVPSLTKKEVRKQPMSDGFAANAIYFKLGFLDKNAVALGRQFRELLPLLWMKTGARGECPQLEGDTIPEVMVLPENHFAILNEESAFLKLEQQLNESQDIDTVFIVTDSEPAFRRMQNLLPHNSCIQLYRDYLDNFRINFAK